MMRRSLRTLALGVTVLTAASCSTEEPGLRCTELGCAGGFDLWMTSTNGSNVFDEGRYDIWADVSGGEAFVRCNVDAAGNGSCDPVEWETRPDEDITIRVTFGVPNAQNVIDTPAIQLHFEGLEEAPSGSSLFGPAMIEMEIDRDTRKVGQKTFTPEYERDDEFNGHVDCGYCDSLERELLRLDP